VCDHPGRHGIDEALVIFKRREQRVVEEGERAVRRGVEDLRAPSGGPQAGRERDRGAGLRCVGT